MEMKFTFLVIENVMEIDTNLFQYKQFDLHWMFVRILSLYSNVLKDESVLNNHRLSPRFERLIKSHERWSRYKISTNELLIPNRVSFSVNEQDEEQNSIKDFHFSDDSFSENEILTSIWSRAIDAARIING